MFGGYFNGTKSPLWGIIDEDLNQIQSNVYKLINSATEYSF